MDPLHTKDQPQLKYIFVAGAPGSKWSSVVKNIYYSNDIDRSDDSVQRSYAHSGAYNGAPMHLGSYFDPGMEFGTWFDHLDQHSTAECEAEFDRPFTGTGIRIIKSHMFMYHVGFLKQNWPDCPVILVHRGDDACLGWWVRCGGFNISYPDYTKYYKDFNFMAQQITQQNQAMRPYWDLASLVSTNLDLCTRLGIDAPPDQYQQIYADSKVQVKVL
jgi:hypothetical protein